MIALSGWGRYPVHEAQLAKPGSQRELASLIGDHGGMIARGNGRAYGDAAIGERLTVGMGRLDRFRSFDPAAGRLHAEAGVLLDDVIATFLPLGWFPPVVPGTRFVSLGGMVAADVHGKNHHAVGGFGAHVEELGVLGPGGVHLRCSAHVSSDLFYATVGGMGLTGVITDVTFQLMRIETAWVRQRTYVADNAQDLLHQLDQQMGATYCVAWIDGLAGGSSAGRGLIFTGEHATREEVGESLEAPVGAGATPSRMDLPVDLPAMMLNRLSVRAFNHLYFRHGAKQAGRDALVRWAPYFFPLDAIGGWNRMYGRRGFLQHQCVLPLAAARAVLPEILGLAARSSSPSFLAVLKRLGEGSGVMSFPFAGYTLALDFGATALSFALLDEIDRLVVRAGGRLYLAKDSRQSIATFEAGYPRLAEFRALRRSIGAQGRFESRLSRRLMPE